MDVRDIDGFSEIIFSGYDGLLNLGQNKVFSVSSFDRTNWYDELIVWQNELRK